MKTPNTDSIRDGFQYDRTLVKYLRQIPIVIGRKSLDLPCEVEGTSICDQHIVVDKHGIEDKPTFSVTFLHIHVKW